VSWQIDCRRIVAGRSSKGKSLVTKQPINFLAMIDTKRGIINERNHELFGKSIKDTILFFPKAIGSSVGAYSIYSLKKNKTAPKAIVCRDKVDIITASGCAIANIPLVDISGIAAPCCINSGMEVHVDANKEMIILTKTV
jgi:uncharacterized protein